MRKFLLKLVLFLAIIVALDFAYGICMDRYRRGIRTGVTGLNGENKHIIEYKLTLDSNPEFTSSVLVAFSRAAYRMHSEGQVGCKTVFDVAPAYLHPESGEALRAKLL